HCARPSAAATDWLQAKRRRPARRPEGLASASRAYGTHGSHWKRTASSPGPAWPALPPAAAPPRRLARSTRLLTTAAPPVPESPDNAHPKADKDSSRPARRPL